jgi:hypothetical protein
MDGWAKIRLIAEYANSSERTVRSWLKSGLRHSRLPSGTILIRYSWVDEFLENHESKENKVDEIVDEAMRGMK